MKQCSKCRVNKEQSEFHKNSCTKDGLQHWCKLCSCGRAKINAMKYREKDINKVKKQRQLYYLKHKSEINEKNAVYNKHNRHIKNRLSVAYKARKLQATPRWHTEWDNFFIEEIYHLSYLRKQMLNIEFAVDHIVPLCGDTVCGLHTPLNLQILTKTDNSIKSNTWNGE